jgi:hypothetical protein
MADHPLPKTNLPPLPSEWTYYAVVLHDRTPDKPYNVFRAKGLTTELYRPGSGWVDTPSLVRYVMLGEDGAEVISKALANRLTGGNAD